jgi:hypothetical protein
VSDQKITAAANKAPLGLIPQVALVGAARVFGYGARKYAPGNFYNASLADGAGQRYVSAALRHLATMQDPNGLHTPESLATLDPESGLPHIDHVLCGLMMLRLIMMKDGALPMDPGVGLAPVIAAPVVLPNISKNHERKCPAEAHTHSWNVPLTIETPAFDALPLSGTP